MSLFTYVEKLVDESYFEKLLYSLQDKLVKNANRSSCLFNLHPIKIDMYAGYLPTYNYEEVPSCLHEIRTIVEKNSNEIFDFVLIHLYIDGSSNINYHSDSEAKNSEIASVSLGATRKFRLRKIGQTKGWDYEFNLKSGDCIYMHKPSTKNNFIGCQSVYSHCVPKELKVKEPRLNLTFRQYEI